MGAQDHCPTVSLSVICFSLYHYLGHNFGVAMVVTKCTRDNRWCCDGWSVFGFQNPNRCMSSLKTNILMFPNMLITFHCYKMTKIHSFLLTTRVIVSPGLAIEAIGSLSLIISSGTITGGEFNSIKKWRYKSQKG